jgi:hypothetical protein
MGDQASNDDGLLRDVLDRAEAAARHAALVLLDGLPPCEGEPHECVTALVDYARRCPDPFQSLDMARLLRAFLDDMSPHAYSRGTVTEWAYAEVRLQALASRAVRVLQDQGDADAQRALTRLALIHMRALEEGPRYPEILGEMARIVDTHVGIRPIAPGDEFFGLARRDSLRGSPGPVRGGARPSLHDWATVDQQKRT